MIKLSLPARIECDAQGCTSSAAAQLVLLPMGTIGVLPPQGWHAMASTQGQGPIIARCPECGMPRVSSLVTP